MRTLVVMKKKPMKESEMESKKDKESPAEDMGNGKARKYVGQRGKLKPKKGKMLTVLTAGLAPRGKNA